MALTSREQQMIDLADSGLSPLQIARAMGIQRSSVVRTLSLLAVNLAADRRHEQAMQAGSRQLLRALVASGHCAVADPMAARR